MYLLIEIIIGWVIFGWVVTAFLQRLWSPVDLLIGAVIWPFVVWMALKRY